MYEETPRPNLCCQQEAVEHGQAVVPAWKVFAWKDQ